MFQAKSCLGLVGSARPEQFVTSPGSGHALEVLLRVDSGRPTGVDGGTAPLEEQKLSEPANPDTFEAWMTPTLDRLQGEWTPARLITSGLPLEASYLAFGSRTQLGVETRIIFGGQTIIHAKIRLHEARTPIEVDYLNVAGKSRGSISLGLFRWEGEDAVFCMAAPGSTRPPDFTCANGSGRTLSTWRRKITGTSA